MPADTHQILCLEHKNTLLYGEVIQMISDRQLCWLRPLALLCRDSQDPGIILELHDLRQGADLLYPQSLFRVALDVEVIPVLTQLELLSGQDKAYRTDPAIAHQQLQSFIRQIWLAHPDAFRSVPSL